MKKLITLTLLFAIVFSGISIATTKDINILKLKAETTQKTKQRPVIETIALTKASSSGQFSLEAAIGNRRSVRSFTNEKLSYETIGQLLWAGQGITDSVSGKRAAPSAGAIFPMELYVVMADGVYRYDPIKNSLLKNNRNDVRTPLSNASYKQQFIKDAPLLIVIAGSPKKIMEKYPNKIKEFMYLEAGHIAQNIHLQAVVTGLASCPVGGFESNKVKQICKMTQGQEAVYIIAVGKPQNEALTLKSADEKELPSIAAVERKKRVVMVLPGDRFDDREFFDTKDVLTTAGFEVDIVAEELDIYRGNRRGMAESNLLLSKVRPNLYDAIILIGGDSTRKLEKNSYLSGILINANNNEKIIAAIGRSAKLIAYRSIVENKIVTGDNGTRTKLRRAGAKFTASTAERDGRIITAQNFKSASQFGKLIVEAVNSIKSSDTSTSGRYVPTNVLRKKGLSQDKKRGKLIEQPQDD